MISNKISSILAVLFVFLISLAVHFPFLNFPTKFTEPEINYLNQIKHYYNHSDFKLTQPPLSNLFYACIVNLKYDSIFPFKNKIQFHILLRIIPALFSSLVLPTITLLLILHDVPISISFLCGVILAFEPSYSSVNRIFGPNSFFYFFSVLTMLVSRILDLNMLNNNNSRNSILLHIESILCAITICSNGSGVIILLLLVLQRNKSQISYQKKVDSPKKSETKSKIYEFWESFKYHLIYSFILFNISIFAHIYLVSGEYNKTPVYVQLFNDVLTLIVPASCSEIFTIRKLRTIHITEHIKILNNPAILLLVYVGLFLSFFYHEDIFSISAFVSFLFAFRYKEQLLWQTPFLFILCIISLGISMTNLSQVVASLIIICTFCSSLLFYVILFSKSYGGEIVL